MTREEAIKLLREGRIGFEYIRDTSEWATNYNAENQEALLVVLKSMYTLEGMKCALNMWERGILSIEEYLAFLKEVLKENKNE